MYASEGEKSQLLVNDILLCNKNFKIQDDSHLWPIESANTTSLWKESTSDSGYRT